MFDIQLTVSAIIFGISTGLFIGMIIFLVINLMDGCSDNKGYIITAIITFIISAICLFFIIRYYKMSNVPEVIHEGLLNDLDKAEKELQKFYIDHPEFKENVK